MLILAFESSAKAASVALAQDGKIIKELYTCDTLTHSETLLPMAERLLQDCGLSVSDLDLIAVAHGPGSFTGIRIGVATVKGLSWASEKPCLGISTLEAMAWSHVSEGGIICPCMDARRSQAYNALFDVSSGTPVRLRPDRAISLEELTEDVRSLSAPVLLVGDGAVIASAAFEAAGISWSLPPEDSLLQHASGVALASFGKTGYPSADLLPVYLRLSQAERERQERLQIQ